MIDDIKKEAEGRMKKALEALGIDDADLKTTRVSMRPYRERRGLA